MEERSIVRVLILSIVTFGIYSILWHFWTTSELNAKGANIPTAWLQIIPIANLYFFYKYYEGAEKVTGGNVNGILYFVLALFVSPVVSELLAQNEYNKMHATAGAATPAAQAPAQPVAMPAATDQPSAPEVPVVAADPTPSVEQPMPSAEPVPATPEVPVVAEPTPASVEVPAATPAPTPMQDITPPPVAPAPSAEPTAEPTDQPPQNPPVVQ